MPKPIDLPAEQREPILKPTEDIPAASLEVQNLRWSTPEEMQSSIRALYQYTEAHASDSIGWYARNKRQKAFMSRSLRFWAIILTTLGGLAPLIEALGWKLTGRNTVGQFGYLFLGLAAACIGLDRFFGFSSGWMRYIATMMSLERALSEFRLDWAMMVAKFGDKEPTPDQVQLMIQRLKDFLVSVDAQIADETQAWVSEFRTNLAEIEKSAKAQAEAARPGVIDITVTNGMETDDGFMVVLDGMEVKRVRGTKYQIGYVAPGTHKVAVIGTIKGEQLEAYELANVMAGASVNITLALPVKEAQP
jgi:hypothetical protein